MLLVYSPVMVYWFDDRIEIINAGGPFGRVTPETFGKPGYADYRNPCQLAPPGIALMCDDKAIHRQPAKAVGGFTFSMFTKCMEVLEKDKFRM